MSSIDTLKLPDDLKKLSYEELDTVAKDVRKFIIDTCSKTGGHLAPSLGVVELTIALLRTFNVEFDRVVWDVGHQSYAYKILTDRKNRFHTLRQFKGISGFIKPSESTFDAFGVGHTSTSISAGLGMKAADDILGRDRKIISVIGDGSMTAGMAFEALNNLGHLDKNMIVVLNDNEMSISPNVGGFSNYLSNLMTGKLYTKFRKDVQYLLERRPLGKPLLNLAKKFEEGLVQMFTPGVLFEEMGLRYIGPVDGHNVKDLEKSLNNALNQDGPVIMHISTKKGKGFKPAEDNPANFHGVSSFDPATGKAAKFGTEKTYTQVFGETLVELGKEYKNVVGITAAMMDGTGLNFFKDEFPDRFFDVGIAEQHAVTFAAGLAISGVKPFVAIYSTFYQRAYDQIIHDVALQNLPVVFCIDRGGMVGADGPTHHGVFDMSFLRCIPNMTIMLPKDGYELKKMMRMAMDIKGPVAIRYPRGTAHRYDGLLEHEPVLGEPEIVEKGGNIAIISAGHIFDESKELWNRLKKDGIESTLINLRFLKPLKAEMITEYVKDIEYIITVEEGSVMGGCGDEILHILNEAGVIRRVRKFGIPDRFIEHGDVKELRKLIGLTGEQMFEEVKKLINK